MEEDKKPEPVASRLARIESRLVRFMLAMGVDPNGPRLDKPVTKQEKETTEVI